MRLKLPKYQTLPRVIPLRVIEVMLIHAHDQVRNAKTEAATRRALRETAVMEMLFATGMRVSELCGLLSSDVDMIEGIVRIRGKGRKERIIQIENVKVLNTLRAYRNADETVDMPFFSIIDAIGSCPTSQYDWFLISTRMKLEQNYI